MTQRTLSPEMDAWLSDRVQKEQAIACAIEPFRESHKGLEQRQTSPAWTREVEFTEAEWRFLWSRFQSVSLPMIGFARRIQASTSDVMTLSAEQRCWALALAYKYRRKVFFNPKAGLLNEQQFVNGIRKLAAAKTKH